MKTIKYRVYKVPVFILIFSLLFVFSIYGLEFKDVDLSNEKYEPINKMVQAGIIDGFTDKTFRPNNAIRRCDFIKILNLTLKYQYEDCNIDFTDVKEEFWYYEHLKTAVKKGYIDGFTDKTFRPKKSITREQFCKIIVKVLDIDKGLFDKEITDDISDWAKPYVEKVVSSGLMALEKDGKFRAKENITRYEVCNVLYNYIVEENDENSSNIGDTDDSSAKVIEALKRVNEIIKDKIIPDLNDEKLIDIFNNIYTNIEGYILDSTIDYKTSAIIEYNKYKKLTKEQQTLFKNIILKYNTLQDVKILKQYFFNEE